MSISIIVFLFISFKRIVNYKIVIVHIKAYIGIIVAIALKTYKTPHNHTLTSLTSAKRPVAGNFSEVS